MLDEQVVMLKGVPPVAPLSTLPTSMLSTWSTQVDSAAHRVKLLSAIEIGLNTWNGHWELTPVEVPTWGMMVALSEKCHVEVAAMV